MFTFIRRWQSGQDVPIKTPPQDRCKRECWRISPAWANSREVAIVRIETRLVASGIH
jgi:hypothetical protein